MAAVAAARLGARVALLERSGCLGGTATGGMVAQWVGFYNADVRVVGGIPFELTERVTALGGSHGFHRYVMAEASEQPITCTNFPFNPEIVKIAADEMAREAGVDVLFHSRVVRPLTAQRRVDGVVVENVAGRCALRAGMVVDATGDAAVAAAAGVPCAGEEEGLRHRRQPCSLVFRLSNVDVATFRALPRERKRELALDGVRQGRLFWESLSFCSTPGGSDAICLMSRISDVDALDARDLSRAENLGRQQVKSIVEYLRERVPGFERAILANIAERTGIRETRRIVGRHVLTETDIVEGRRFPDAIALGAGPMDLHEAGGTGIQLWMPPAPFEIPLACLLPVDVQGLIVSGRAISATREANGGARHMATAMALGHAAGVYAALKSGRAPREETSLVSDVRSALREQGALLSALAAMRASAGEQPVPAPAAAASQPAS